MFQLSSDLAASGWSFSFSFLGSRRIQNKTRFSPFPPPRCTFAISYVDSRSRRLCDKQRSKRCLPPRDEQFLATNEKYNNATSNIKEGTKRWGTRSHGRLDAANLNGNSIPHPPRINRKSSWSVSWCFAWCFAAPVALVRSSSHTVTVATCKKKALTRPLIPESKLMLLHGSRDWHLSLSHSLIVSRREGIRRIVFSSSLLSTKIPARGHVIIPRRGVKIIISYHSLH